MQSKTEQICFCFWLHRHIFIVLYATTGGVCNISHATVVGVPVGVASAGFNIVFSLAPGIIKKLLKTTKKKKKKKKKQKKKKKKKKKKKDRKKEKAW